MTKYGIDSTVICQIIDLANRHHIKTVILFGSRARGDFRRTSDIDLIWHIFTMEMPRKHWLRRLLAALFRPLKSWKKASVSDTPIFWIRSEKLFYKHMEAHDGT